MKRKEASEDLAAEADKDAEASVAAAAAAAAAPGGVPPSPAAAVPANTHVPRPPVTAPFVDTRSGAACGAVATSGRWPLRRISPNTPRLSTECSQLSPCARPPSVRRAAASSGFSPGLSALGLSPIGACLAPAGGGAHTGPLAFVSLLSVGAINITNGSDDDGDGGGGGDDDDGGGGGDGDDDDDDENNDDDDDDDDGDGDGGCDVEEGGAEVLGVDQSLANAEARTRARVPAR